MAWEDKYEPEKRKSTIKNYQENWDALQGILEDIKTKGVKVSEEDLSLSKRFPEYDDALFGSLSTKELGIISDELRRTISFYINKYFVESWKNTIEHSFDGEEKIEDRINYLDTLLKMEPVETYKAMSISCYFLNKLEEAKGKRSSYQKVLNEIAEHCSEVPATADAVNYLDFAINSKYPGVIKAVTIGLKANPLTKDPNNVKNAYRPTYETVLGNVFAKRDKEENEVGSQPGEE